MSKQVTIELEEPGIISSPDSQSTEFALIVSAAACSALSPGWRMLTNIGGESERLENYPTREEAEIAALSFAQVALDVLKRSTRLQKYRPERTATAAATESDRCVSDNL